MIRLYRLLPWRMRGRRIRVAPGGILTCQLEGTSLHLTLDDAHGRPVTVIIPKNTWVPWATILPVLAKRAALIDAQVEPRTLNHFRSGSCPKQQ
jgi:hypothetical protein